MNKRRDKVGNRYGRLLIKSAYHEKKGRRWYHLFSCDCGATKLLCGSEVRRGKTLSCGCFRREQKTTHGMTSTPEYWVWSAMIQRCSHEDCAAYKNYGGRGITVCERWLMFENFISDMGMRPGKDYTLERIDNNKGYGPDNCMWADRFSQSINQRLRIDNKTGFRGVSYNKRDGKYYAKICAHKRQHHLGCYEKIEDAIEARIAGEQKYFNLNGEQHG